MARTPSKAHTTRSTASAGDRPSRLDRRGLLILCLIYLAVAALWETPVVYPLRLFVVLLHEAGHALAAVATGGRALEIQVFANEGGHCRTVGGWPVIILSAGYLGSLVLGGTILLGATRTRQGPHLALALGGAVVLCGILLMPTAFGRVFAVAFGGCLAASSFLPRIWPETALRVIGVTSCLYALIDLKGDVLDRPGAVSDASLLAERTGVPTLVWGGLWAVVSLVVTALVAKWSVFRPTPDRESPPRPAPRSR